MISPGAVPRGLSMVRAPSGTSAWRRFISAMRWTPMRSNRSRSHASSSGWRTRDTPATSARASRVTSSWVGPRPPVRITASARPSASRMVPAMRSVLSPTTVWRRQSQPTSARRWPIQAALVLTIWPSSSSVPTPMISQRTLAPCRETTAAGMLPGRPGQKLRALGGGDHHRQVLPHPEASWGALDPDHAVGVGGLPEAAALGGAAGLDPLDQHLEPAPDPGLLGLGQHAILHLLGPLDPVPGGGLRDAAVQAEGGRAVLGRPGEEGHPVEAGRLQERLQLAHVGPALAREAEDEVGAEGGVGVEGADPPDQVEEALGRAAAAHAPQHGRAGVLQRQVEVAADDRVGGHLLEQPGRELVGLEVVEADPAQAVDPGQVAQQVDQGLAAAQVLAVAGRVLGNQADLGDALA